MSELLAHWRGRGHFVLLDTDFGNGQRFLASWQAWRADAQRCAHLHCISLLRVPLGRADLRSLLGDTAWPGLAEELADAWSASTPGLHRLGFDRGGVTLLLAVGATAARLSELVAQVDAFVVDDMRAAKALAASPLRLAKALARLAAPGASLSAGGVDAAELDALRTAGFVVAPADDGNRTQASYAPRYAPRRPAGRASAATRAAAGDERRALIVGAGLAGCAAAWALAEHGWHSTLFDRHAEVAQEASGNPAGLFHGTVHAHDGNHARFNRAAARQVHGVVVRALREDAVAGSAQGLLRLETSLDVATMRTLLARLGLPPEHVQALDQAEASLCAAMPLPAPAWFYPEGGWVDPAGLCRAYLRWAGLLCTWRGAHEVQRLERHGSAWRLLDAAGQTLGEAPVVVFAHAGAAVELLGRPDWPVEPVRGQLSLLPEGAPGHAGLALPRVPVAGYGYLLPAVRGQAVFGATSTRDDGDPRVRAADHEHNLKQLGLLTGKPSALRSTDLLGRTSWRWAAADRLPLIGPVPDTAMQASETRQDQPRLVARWPGLHVFTALGSRGIAWSALGAQVLASGISGAPVPLEASLLDAVDPARFVCRAARRRGTQA